VCWFQYIPLQRGNFGLLVPQVQSEGHNILGFNPGTPVALAGSYVQAQVPQAPPQIITIMDGWPMAKA